MKFNLIVLLLIVCVLELTRGYYYDEEEDGLRVIVKRQANYYNNYDYNAETTTLATTKKKLIKRCPTNAAGKRIRCKKKKKRTTTTTTTTEEPIGLPPSFLRGPPGINPISFFLGPGSFYSPTTPSTVSTTITTNKPSLNSLPTVKLGGNFLHNLPIITGGMLPRSPPTNSSLLNVPAAIASQFPFNTSFPGENNRISPAGAIQFAILPKMIKTCNSSTSINVDPIVSGSTTVPTTPSSLINSLTTGSRLGSLVLPIGSSGLNASSLNFFLPNNSTIQINTATTIKPAGLSNVTNSISNTSNPILRPILRDMPMFPIQNLTSEVNSNSSQNTIVAPIMTTGSSNMGSLLGRIGFPIGISGTTVSSTILTTASSSSSVTLLTTVASNMGSFLGRVGLPVGLSPITSLNSSIQTLLPITTTSIPLTTSKSTTVLPILSSTSNQSIPSSSTTVKLGLILPLQPNAILSSTTLGTTVSSVTLSNTTNSSLSTNATTTISSQQTTLAISKDSSTVPSMATIIKDSGTTIGLAVNGTSTTSSNALTTKKSSKTTKKKGKKRKTTKKKNQKKTTKKAGKKQGTTNQKGNGEKKQE